MAEGSRTTERCGISSDSTSIILKGAGASATGQEEFTRDPDFWLEDGNVILITGEAAFRVFRCLLAKQSVVFADMFHTGSPDAKEMFDRCPVVRLSDHPDDLRDFLHCLMPCSTRDFKDGRLKWHFAQIHAVIHLAHKYQCPAVEERALFLLTRYYTTAFVDHDFRMCLCEKSTSTA